jgi:hypothetical protein
MGKVIRMFEIPEIIVGRISQATWDVMSPEFRSETERLAREMTAGIEKYRPGAERDADLAEFHALAASKGTTVKVALNRFVAMEHALRADPTAGLMEIFKNLGINPQSWARDYLSREAV